MNISKEPFRYKLGGYYAGRNGYEKAEKERDSHLGEGTPNNIYSGIGMNKLLELTERRGCKFVVWNGRTRIIIRERLDKFIDKAYSI